MKFSATFFSRLIVTLAAVVFLFPFCSYSLPFTSAGTSVESRDFPGNQFTLPASGITFSDDGRYVVFSTAERVYDTAQCSTPGTKHIFWIDKTSLRARCISRSSKVPATGLYLEGNADSVHPFVSVDGRYVAYESKANNLTVHLGATTVGRTHVYVHDRQWEETWLSRRKTNPTDEPDGSSYLNMISSDGKLLVVESDATNYYDEPPTPPIDYNNVRDVFIRDGSDCEEGYPGACNGDIIWDNFYYHATGTATLLSGPSRNGAIDSTAAITVFESGAPIPVFYAPDLNDASDIFLYTGGEVSRISGSYIGGVEANCESTHPSIDEAGVYVAFDSIATDLVTSPTVPTEAKAVGDIRCPGLGTSIGVRQIYLYNTSTQEMKLISKTDGGAAGNGPSWRPTVSANGKYVVYHTGARNLLPDEYDGLAVSDNIVVYDINNDRTYLVTPGTGGYGLKTGNTSITDVSSDGFMIGFESTATDVVASDANGSVQDVFIATNQCPLDRDGDGTPDCIDDCPADSNKVAPGQCGCGALDTDTDSDGVADCLDVCDNDATKTTSAGFCGCGVAETDTDSDGTPNCVDGCPVDPLKTSAGGCGCGVSDTDSDGDGVADCVDVCPGEADVDNNGNGIADCNDPILSGDRPSQAKVSVSTREKKTTFTFDRYDGVIYEVEISKSGNTIITFKTNNYITSYALSAGSYKVRYRITIGSDRTSWASWKSFTVTKISNTSSSSSRSIDGKRPKKASISVSKANGLATIRLEAFRGATYEVEVIKNGKSAIKNEVGESRVKVNLQPGSYKVRYRVKDETSCSKWSSASSFRVR